jgi:DNA-binding CsgD family transcriptional regulator
VPLTLPPTSVPRAPRSAKYQPFRLRISKARPCHGRGVVAIKAYQGDAASRPLQLTPAEARVVLLLPTHLTIDAMAERLGRRPSTVKTHVAHIYEKLGATTRGEAVARARELGLLADPDASSASHGTQVVGSAVDDDGELLGVEGQ